jgi:hypothetical protein
MKKVFVCSAYGGKWDNILLARKYCSWAIWEDVAPIAPHLIYTQFLTESPTERELGLQAGLQYLAVCDEVWVFSADGQISSGMQLEVDRALELRIPIKWHAYDGEINPLKHIPSDRLATHKELLTDTSFSREVSTTFAYVTAQLKSDVDYIEVSVLLDKLLGTELEPRDERVEAEWVLAQQGDFDE